MALHTINKVVLDFSFEEKEKANALVKTKQLFYEDMLPQMNQNFDDKTEYIYINKLEIDLGKTTLQNLRSDFLKTFKRRWNECYPNYIIKTGENTSPVSIHQAQLFSVDHFIFFLQRGYWPWNFQTKSEKELTGFIQDLLKDKAQLSELLEKTRNEKQTAITRLRKFIFEKSSLQKLFINGLTIYHPALSQSGILLDEYYELQKKETREFGTVFFNELFISPPLYVVDDIKELVIRILEKYFTSRQRLSKERSGSIKQLQTLLRTKKKFEAKKALLLLKILVDERSDVPGLNDAKEETAHLPHHVKPEDKTIPIPYFIDEEKEKINIGNAGLVLFHPYLCFVFKELEWTNNENKFVSSKAQQKAILFLQYLINGKSRQQEYELVLNKILCNWKLNLPLETSCNFSVKEKLAAYELNKSLREHWSSLKDTSGQGLIKSFIERKGIIQKEEKSFLLVVEKNSIDILMESLPFGIQTIKLPWNEYIIHTEWTY